MCTSTAIAQRQESEPAVLWREALTLQLHVSLQPVNAVFVEKDSVNQL